MDRTLEPELMENPAQVRAYAAADFSRENQGFVDRFREYFPDFSEGHVLDLGCGPADVTIRFAKAFPDVTVLGVDGSHAMLALGRRHVHEAGMDSRITLEKRYLPDTNLELKSFDGVISNSLLHHLADPGTLWRTAAAAAKPNGAVLIVDLLRPHMVVFYDESGAIGRRYRRQDEIGTPFGVTVDFETLGERDAALRDTVTLRNRDSMKQERVAIHDLPAILRDRLS